MSQIYVTNAPLAEHLSQLFNLWSKQPWGPFDLCRWSRGTMKLRKSRWEKLGHWTHDVMRTDFACIYTQRMRLEINQLKNRLRLTYSKWDGKHWANQRFSLRLAKLGITRIISGNSYKGKSLRSARTWIIWDNELQNTVSTCAYQEDE